MLAFGRTLIYVVEIEIEITFQHLGTGPRRGVIGPGRLDREKIVKNK